jgi:hypothetical protein
MIVELTSGGTIAAIDAEINVAQAAHRIGRNASQFF